MFKKGADEANGLLSFEVMKHWSFFQNKTMEMIYVPGYLIIGLVAGLVAKRYRPSSVPDSVLVLSLLGILGSVIAGLLTLMVLSYGRMSLYDYGYTDVYSGDNAATLPAFWMSLITALIGAVFVLAIYKLVRAKRASA